MAAAYFHLPHPFKGQFGNGAPILGRRAAWRLKKTLEKLAQMGQLEPIEIDTALNTYAAKVQTESGRNVYTYVHPVIDVPSAMEISDEYQPGLPLPVRVAWDLVTAWPDMAYVPHRKAWSAAPCYRLLMFPMRHRYIHDIEQEDFVYTLSFLDRQADRLVVYDFEHRGSPGRALDISRFWHYVEVNVAAKNKNMAMPREINFSAKLRTVDVLDALQLVNESQRPQRGIGTLWSLLSTAVHLINESQANDPLPRIAKTVDALAGMRTDLLPRLFVELLVILKTQTIRELGDGSLTRAFRNTYWLRKRFKLAPWRLRLAVRPFLQSAEDARQLHRGTTNALCDEWHAVLDQNPDADVLASSEDREEDEDGP